MSYPDHKTYEKLYRRFILGDRSNQMLCLAGDLRDKVFLDICCGSGRLTKAALDKGTKKNIMIDAEARMVSSSFKTSEIAQILIMQVEEALENLINRKDSVDVAICQQGINYWLTSQRVEKLSMSMSQGGVFIFNTFNQKPSNIPKVREYTLTDFDEIGDSHYVETSWWVENDWFDIYHIQICSGEEPHFTKFKWMSEEYIRNCLDKWFEVDIITDNKTSIYKCVKK